MSEAERPSAQLAMRLIDQLIKAGLIRDEKRDQVATKIAGGTMKGEDWKLEIDLAGDKEAST
jgi:hypothetical protein